MEKIEAIQQIVKEQVDKGHLKESNSPWNTPVFVIKKKSGKWRLLQDLRAVNATMEDMGALQPGLPSPVAIPRNYHIIVIDLQDCFFTIKLNPIDCKRFAFSVPSVNHKEPCKRYEWQVLPQGMKNSPTLCQKFVDMAVSPLRHGYPEAYIIHFMDDILIGHEDINQARQILREMTVSLEKFGLSLAPDKIQENRPIQYLGHKIHEGYLTSQHAHIRRDKLNTLNDFQKLLGNINWVRPYLKITTGELSPLFDILHGDSHPKSKRQLTPEATAALQLVEERLEQARLHQVNYAIPWALLIMKTAYTPTGCLWQDALLEWVHLPHSPSKGLISYPSLVAQLIVKGRTRSKEIFGRDMQEIVIPYSRLQFEQLLQESDDWGLALMGYTGQIKYHLPKHPIIEFVKETALIFPQQCSIEPLTEAQTIFTDGSSNGVAVVWTEGEPPIISHTGKTSAQQTELAAVTLAFRHFPQTFNLYTDSKYIVSLFPTIETALITGRSTIKEQLKVIQDLILQRKHKFFIGHIRGHTNLPGALAFGNAMADHFTRANLCLTIQEAEDSHALHHQNANALRYQFKITREQARHIVRTCGACPPARQVHKMGVNPRGLKPNHLWQMDVTHVPEFGRLCYVHICVDTFSHAVLATARTGEAVKDVIQHMVAAMAVLGQPLRVKTDNGPAYISKPFAKFCNTWKIRHVTGIPYNPQGQAIIERTHQDVKAQIKKLREASPYLTPHHVLSHALFTLNHLNLNDTGQSRMERHWNPSQDNPKPLVKWKDQLTGLWKGPDPLITSGRGYACVFPQDGESPIWIPDRLIRHVATLQPKPKEDEAATEETAEVHTDAAADGEIAPNHEPDTAVDPSGHAGSA